ncbi:histone-lysine N-methyltransferase SETMAR-like, partial [Octopus sinensis]|uniref:Histone-lysine N-methyltransferase SETMAR-like n=1 Tax=Octopus sinensis TaxID=2607531 RepID=A0A6P7U6A8_9MOLL
AFRKLSKDKGVTCYDLFSRDARITFSNMLHNHISYYNLYHSFRRSLIQEEYVFSFVCMVYLEGPTSDRTVRRWFQKFRSGNERLEDEEGRGRSCSFDNERLKAIVEQNLRQRVKEMSQALGVGTAMVSRSLKNIDEVKMLD